MEENSENEHPEKIYSKIIDKEYITFKFNQIVLGTKKLISNNTNFKDYSKEYEEITKITTFKNPDEEYFPLLKNEEIVSLSRVKFSYDSRKNKLKKVPKIKIKKFKLTDKSLNHISNDANNIELDINRNAISLVGNSPHNNKKLLIKIKNDNNKKNINTLSEESYSNKNKTKLYSDKNSSIVSNNKQINNNFNSLIINKDILQSPTSISTTTQNSFFNKNKKKVIIGNSMKYYKNKTIIKRNIFRLKDSLTLLSAEKKKILYNNRVLLRDILLQEKDYNKLKYEENKIFLSQDYYYKYILKQMDYIKKNKIKLGHPEKFEKIYENSKFGKPKLTLSPITVEFKQKYSFDDKVFNINDKQVFNIPFEYIPIFYFNNFEKLKEILISIFYLDKSFTTFYSKYENLAYILRNSSEFKEQNEGYKDNKKALYKKEFTYKLQLSHSQTLNKSFNFNFRNSKIPANTKKRDSLKLIDIYKTEYNFNNLPFYINVFNKNKIYFGKKNIFEFIWITPSYQYLVTLKTPEICFKINGIEIKKNISIELLFFLSEKNFENWDFYLIDYLFSYNDFILIINSFYSICKSKFIKNLKYNYDYKNNVIHLTKEKKVKYSKKNTKLEFIFTDDDLNNYIKVLHNYKLFVFNKNINPYYQFCFHLNFIQMKSLYLASKKQGIKYILEKIIITDKDNMKIKLNYEYLDNFCKNDLNILEPLLPSGLSLKSHKYNFFINDSKFCLFYPMLEIIKFNKKSVGINNNCFESNLEEELKNTINFNILESLFKNNNVYEWPNIIQFIDNQEKLKKQRRKSLINFPNLYIKNINKKIPSNTISSKNIEIMK